MVKRKKALKGAKGSALFMVICVMAILMVVAITAMAMVSLAYTRSLQNYTASQSYVTAVNTLDMIIEATDNTSTANDYGQVALSVSDRVSIADPLYDVIEECNTDVYNGGTYDNSKAGGQVKYGEVEFDTVGLSGIQFVDFTDSAGNVLGQIKYEVLPDPKHDPSDTSKGSEVPRGQLDGTTSTTPVKYGTLTKFESSSGGMDYEEYYAFARVKMTVKVQSGSGDTAQVRTVSRIYDALLYEKDSRSAARPPQYSDPSSNSGKFTQAVKTMGLYTSGTGMNVIGGLSSFGGGGSFAGLKGNTSSVYINGDFDPVDSGHNGQMDIGAGQQITINGKFSVNNNFKFNSVFNPSTDTGYRPFLYCEEIDWSNSNIPSGYMDILTKNGGVYGRDNNSIMGNVLSGGDLTLVGNNLDISGAIFVDGDVNIQNSIKGTGTIYTTGNVTGNNNGVKVVKLPAGTNFDINDPESTITDPDSGTLTVTTPTTPSTTYNISTDKSVFGAYFEDGDPTKDVITAESKPDTVDNEIPPASTGVIEINIPEGETQTIYLPPGDYTDMEIVITGGGDAKIFQDGNINLTSCKIWSEFVKNKVENGETIDMKTLADDPAYSIIEWEVAAGATLEVGHIGGNGTFINAYIYGPDAGIMQTAAGTPNGPEVTVIDEFGREQKMKTWLMGAVVGNDLTMSDGGPGIIFINPDGTGSGGGNGAGQIIDPGSPAGSFSPEAVRYNLKSSATGNGYYTNR